jgi:hypothetical protein
MKTITKRETFIYYLLLTMMSLGFIGASLPKLMGDPHAIAGFAQAHLPAWFMYFVGCCELAGAIGLWIRKLSLYAAYGLWIILAGAVVTTLIFVNASMAVMPLVYALVLWIIVWMQKRRNAARQMTAPEQQTKAQ